MIIFIPSSSSGTKHNNNWKGLRETHVLFQKEQRNQGKKVESISNTSRIRLTTAPLGKYKTLFNGCAYLYFHRYIVISKSIRKPLNSGKAVRFPTVLSPKMCLYCITGRVFLDFNKYKSLLFILYENHKCRRCRTKCLFLLYSCS